MEDRNTLNSSDIDDSDLQTQFAIRHVPRTAAILSSDTDLIKDTYLTHFNGGRPFVVVVQPSVVTIYDNSDDPPSLLMTFTDVRKTFIGKSPLTPMTEFSGGHGKMFDGNSILIQTESLRYVFIGSMIYSFDAVSNIISYVSEVGNNDVPYPYAVDDQNNVYLMIESVIVKNYLGTLDPYNDLLYRPPNLSGTIEDATEGIVNLIGTDYSSDIGEEESVYRVSWQKDASEHYNRPWMSNLKAVYKDGSMKYLSENDYVIVMKAIGDALGLRVMRTDVLYPTE